LRLLRTQAPKKEDLSGDVERAKEQATECVMGRDARHREQHVQQF
jgi:hypothetical protein